VRDGLAPAGDLVITIDDAPARCRAPQAWSRAGDDWREVARGPAPTEGPAEPDVLLAPGPRDFGLLRLAGGQGRRTRRRVLVAPGAPGEPLFDASGVCRGNPVSEKAAISSSG
jgi:hypothetical protein